MGLLDRAELLSRRTRGAFRDACSDLGTVRTVARAFENEGFAPAADDAAPVAGDPSSWDRDGQRRGTFDQHTAGIDWTEPALVTRALAVFEEIYDWGGEQDRLGLARHLKRDGYLIDDAGRIRPTAGPSPAELPLGQLRHPSALLEHLDRLTRLGDTDPPLAVTGAKSLVEATVKLVLEELAEPVSDRSDIPMLVKQANKALKLDPRGVAPTAAGAEIVVRVLANLAQVPVGLAELRNQYGPDHGRTRPVVGLHPRHAQLAVGAATTYCRFLLATLADHRSPGTS